MKVMVIKADRSRQAFDGDKVIATSMRLGANRREAEEIARKIERRVYDGITTSRVLQLIFQYMRKYKPKVNNLFDLRRGLSLMNSKPEFEKFVQILLAATGFQVDTNRILKGKCGEHEVDAIARKNGVTYFVEAKHHYNYHAYTGLDESRIARALLEDVTEGFDQGVTNVKIDKAMLVTNTKYSEQALRYGACRNILQIGWSTPADRGLRDIIQEENLHPLSCVRGLKAETRMKLVESGIVLISQVLERDSTEIAERAFLPVELVRAIKEKVESV